MEPQDRGYEKSGEKGPLTKYVKETEDGRSVIYHTPEGAVRVNENPRMLTVAHSSPAFFWSGIQEGLLHENERVESVEEAHALAQETVETLMG